MQPNAFGPYVEGRVMNREASNFSAFIALAMFVAFFALVIR